MGETVELKTGMRVVLTGPARDAQGNPVLRADLVEKAKAAGLFVQTEFGPDTQLVVASRFDTLKAQGAAKAGIPMVGYAEFIQLLGGVPQAAKSRHTPSKWVDTHPLPKPPTKGPKVILTPPPAVPGSIYLEEL